MASHPIYQFKAVLRDYKPRIWRRFQVSNDISLARLAYTVMTMFEMEANHLFAIEVYKRRNIVRSLRRDYPGVSEETLLSYCPADDIVRYQIVGEEDEYLDNEPLDPVAEKIKYAIHHAGDELCVEYEENRAWLGVDDLDLASFDLEDMNFRIKKIPRIYADIYERDLTPTRASENLLMRKYKKNR